MIDPTVRPLKSKAGVSSHSGGHHAPMAQKASKAASGYPQEQHEATHASCSFRRDVQSHFWNINNKVEFDLGPSRVQCKLLACAVSKLV
eukprot:6196608-Pleurochrysis_carterae.AAC.4